MLAEGAVLPASSILGEDMDVHICSLSSLQIPSESEHAVFFPLNFAPLLQAWKLPSEDHTENMI